MTMRGGAGSYRITTGDGRSTEELVEAGEYAYAHSCVTSENFPARHFDGRQAREIILVEFDHDVTSEEAIAEATHSVLSGRRTRMLSTSGSSIPTCSGSTRWSFSMTRGSVSSAAEMFYVSGPTPAVESWVSKGSTTVGSGTPVSRSFARTTARGRPRRRRAQGSHRGSKARSRTDHGQPAASQMVRRASMAAGLHRGVRPRRGRGRSPLGTGPFGRRTACLR